MQLLFGFLLFVATFSKAEYFKIIAGSEASAMSTMQAKIDKGLSGTEKDAYAGALKMKQAEAQKNAKRKIRVF